MTKLLENEENTDEDDEGVVFEKFNEFQYLGAVLSVENDWSSEIGMRIIKAEGAALAQKVFEIKIIFKEHKG